MEIKVGKKIKLLRKKNDVTQDKLAAYLGVTPQAVSRWESETCYPDIESLPSIADFFGVSMDELMCYDSLQKEQKVAEYLEQVEVLYDRDELAEALALLREAIAEIPSSFELQLELATTLSAINADGKPRKADMQEAVSLCMHILEDCTDDLLRDRTKKTLCDIYSHQLGDDERAQEIANKLHSMSYSREIVKATVLTGEVAFNQAQENLILFADNMWWHMYNIACVPDISGNHYTVDEKIEILQKAVDLFHLLFGENDLLYYHDRLANSYRQLAMFYLMKGDKAAALAAAEKMADHAIAYDTRPESATYTSLPINCVQYEKETEGATKCAKLLAGRFGSRIWAPIRDTEQFRAIIARMSEFA